MSFEREAALGATLLPDGRVRFLVWAPYYERVQVHLTSPSDRLAPMEPLDGYHHAVVDGAGAGARYVYRLGDGRERPDPASRSQPDGVHGPSAVVDPRFPWTDAAWSGLPLEEYVFYELHTGTFTPEGTFESIVPHLRRLRDLGVTAIELMPVAQFSGARNWGYDGVYPYAPHDAYGGPDGLKRLVDAAHGAGLAVVLDVVYNHLGPEGNYLRDFGPYFTKRYVTPWGAALNYDDEHSDEVRRFFIDSALHWVTDYHIDAFRLDAIEEVHDRSAVHFLRELAGAVHKRAGELGRRVHVIAESDLNDPRVVRPVERGGHGLDAQWNDDFHHALHALLTGERFGYYQDFGRVSHLAKAYREGFVNTWQRVAFRKRRHGDSSVDVPAHRFAVCSQNHDQAGNRLLGERLSALASFEQLKLAAGAVILSPYLPLLFMGEEYGDTAPFLYFVSHSDEKLVRAVRRGRRREFAAFAWRGRMPDPQAESTFERSKLDHALRETGKHRALYDLYGEMLRLRRSTPALANLSKDELDVTDSDQDGTLLVRRWRDDNEVVIGYNFAEEQRALPLPAGGRWRKRVDSAAERWAGPGSPAADALAGEASVTLAAHAFALYERES